MVNCVQITTGTLTAVEQQLLEGLIRLLISDIKGGLFHDRT